MRMLAAMVLISAASAPAVRAEDAEAGRALAERWCSGCHLVSAGTGARGPDVAPTFESLAAAPRGSDGWLRAWLVSPHPTMPQFDLTDAQVEDVVAYLESLVPARD